MTTDIVTVVYVIYVLPGGGNAPDEWQLHSVVSNLDRVNANLEYIHEKLGVRDTQTLRYDLTKIDPTIMKWSPPQPGRLEEVS
jgi:hypothetical protein